MAGELIAVWGAAITLEATGAAIANNTISAAATTAYAVVTDGASFPDADFVLTCTFAVAPVDGSIVALYARPLDVDGTADTEVPEAVRPTMYIGSFIVNNIITVQSIVLTGGYAKNLPKLASYYLHNSGTGQSISAGWTLKITPRTKKIA